MIEELEKQAVGAVVGGASGFSFIPWVALVFLLAVGGVGIFGYHKGAQLQALTDQAKYQKAQQEAETKWQAMLDAANAKGNQLAADLEKEKANIKTVTVTVVKEVPKVTTVYKDSLNAPTQTIPDPIVTWGFVRLWNDALEPSVQHDVSHAAGLPASAADIADLIRSPAKLDDILTNQAVNASQYAECREQLNRLIDFETQKNPAR